MTSLLCNIFSNNRPGLSLIPVLIIAAVLAGCGEKAKSTQVAAKVNSEEITVSQVNGALASLPVTPGKTVDEARQEVLDNLIVQKLANQQAIKAKLDRTPAVMQAIDNAKNTILARAYMDPIVAGIAKPTSEDVHKFYIEHPELFSARHIYNLRELEVETKPELAASIRDQVGKGEGLDAIAAWLKDKNIPSTIQTGVKSAEQLPLEMVTRLSKMAAGQLMVVEFNKTISVLQVVATKIEPVEEAVVSASIQEYLSNSRKKEALDKEIKALKAAAKIEYIGEHEVKTAAAEVPEKAVAQPGAPDVAKGVAGLK